jgi:thiamine biosynthesis lipoprotein
MRKTRVLMGMPITVEIVGGMEASLNAVFDYFTSVDARFSTYKLESEITKINRGKLGESGYSAEMREVFALAKETKRDSDGYFDIRTPRRLPAGGQGPIDPSGLVKGWAIRNAARLVENMGYKDYFLDAGGDIQSNGADALGQPWTIGVRNPFNRTEIVKVLRPHGRGVATSGTYVRGQHIYNPHEPDRAIEDIVSMTVIGPDIYEADRFATAAFAMGRGGIAFIERLRGFEGYLIDAKGVATMTSGFGHFVA